MVVPPRTLAPSPRVITGAFTLCSVAFALAACGNDAGGGAAASTSGTGAGATAGAFPDMSAPGGSSNVTGGSTAAGSSTGGVSASAGTAAGGATSGSGGAPSGGSADSAGSGGSGGSVSSGGMPPDVSPEGDGDITVGPTYTKDPNLTDLGKPKGKKFSFNLPSSASTIFKGDDVTLTKPWRMAGQTSFNRNISVYVPNLYKDGTEAPILVIQDGPGQIDGIARALDNLTLSTDPLKKLPPFVAIAVANGSDRDGSDGKGSERGLEYDTMSDRYSRFVDTEVLPAVIADPMVHAAYPGLKFTKDPEGRGTFGCSSGGAAALSMAWFAETLWHRAITYSGTFVAQQNDTQPEAQMYPLGAWEYHSDLELIKNTAKKPLRVFLNANEMDLGYMNPVTGHKNWLIANQLTAAALKAQGYHYRFVYAQGVAHCDGKVQDQTMADALSWAWRGYVAPQ